LSDDERQVERLLAALPLRESRINRDHTMFLAGRASAPPQAPRLRLSRWIWPATSVATTVAGVLAGILISASLQRGPVPALVPTVAERTDTQQPSLAETAEQKATVADSESSSLLEHRLRAARRAGDEFLLARVDALPQDGAVAEFARRDEPRLAVTYRELLGRSLENEEHP
jgi:hypothetical protein